jgi:hypothetical protein
MGLSIKYCSTHYADRHSIGEGAEELNSSVKREALIQFDWKW